MSLHRCQSQSAGPAEGASVVETSACVGRGPTSVTPIMTTAMAARTIEGSRAAAGIAPRHSVTTHAHRYSQANRYVTRLNS